MAKMGMGPMKVPGVTKLLGEFGFLRPVAVFVLFLAICAFIGIRRSRAAERIVPIVFALWLLGYKLAECVVTGDPPMDFSALTYFLFGLAVLLPSRGLKSVASFCALLAAFLYFASMLAFPRNFVLSGYGEADRYLAFIHHAMLFLGGLMLLDTVRFRPIDLLFVFAFVLFSAGYTVLLSKVFHIFVKGAVFTTVLDGTIIHQLVPDWKIPLWYYFVYYPCGIALGVGIWFAVYRLNGALRKHRVYEG